MKRWRGDCPVTFIICSMIALICYSYSFMGVLLLCRFMEWDVTFGLDAAEPAEFTIHTLLNTDWGALLSGFLADVLSSEPWVPLLLLVYVVLLVIVLALLAGIFFLAYYVPYRAFLELTPEKIKDRNYKKAKRFALIASLISHPVMWYLGLHHGMTLFDIFGIIVLAWADLVIGYYVIMLCIAMTMGPAAGAIFAVGRSVSGKSELSAMPFIVYDDSNGQWKRRGIFGDHAIYYNGRGNEVTIYAAQVSGNSANTSAGTFHWY